MTFNTKVHMEQGGGTLTVESGGAIDIKAGGKVFAGGVQAGAISDVDTAGSATAAANATAINAILAALRGAGIIAAS